jgi:hypothetical protein
LFKSGVGFSATSTEARNVLGSSRDSINPLVRSPVHPVSVRRHLRSYPSGVVLFRNISLAQPIITCINVQLMSESLWKNKRRR